jgi:rubrerythrin
MTTPPEGGEPGRELSSSPPIPATPTREQLTYLAQNCDETASLPRIELTRIAAYALKLLDERDEARRGFKYEADVAEQAIAAKEKAEAELERLRGALDEIATDFGDDQKRGVFFCIQCDVDLGGSDGEQHPQDRAKGLCPVAIAQKALRPPPSDADKAGKENEG